MERIKYPKAILFDYGHTLAKENSFDSLAGYRALMRYAASNPKSVTAEEIAAYDAKLFGYLMKNAHTADIELAHRALFRTLFETFGVKFDLSELEMELIYWENASPIEPMPGAVEVIDYLNEKGIPTAVVSNLSFSGEALHYRLRSILPRERFCFVMSSCDYGWRKPNSFLFNAALANIGERAEDIWFCGDNTQADIKGASDAGMVPVWVRSPIICTYRDPAHDTAPEVSHILTDRVDRLIELLEKSDTSGTQCL